MSKQYSQIGDLTKLAKEMEGVITKNLNLKERASIVIAFTLPPDYNICHWVTTVKREDAIHIMDGVKERMTMKQN